VSALDGTHLGKYNARVSVREGRRERRRLAGPRPQSQPLGGCYRSDWRPYQHDKHRRGMEGGVVEVRVLGKLWFFRSEIFCFEIPASAPTRGGVRLSAGFDDTTERGCGKRVTGV
jgi:hypothetical protein